MMFCPKCGCEAKGGAGFCGSCGASLRVDTVAAGSDAASATAASASTSTAKVIVDEARRQLAGRGKLVAIASAVAVVVIAGAVFAFMALTGGFTSGQTAASFEGAFKEQQPYVSYLPSENYVVDVDYDLTSLKVSDLKEEVEGWVTAKVEATLENDTYTVGMSFRADYYAPSANSVPGQYLFEMIDESVEAKAGIAADKERGLQTVESVLSEDGRTCQIVQTETDSLWFADSTVTTTCTYALAEDGWHFDEENQQHVVTYKDLEGTYAAKQGDMTSLASFAITGFDSATGKVTISVSRNEAKDSYSTEEGFTATLSATIDPKRGGEFEMEDGYSYYFEANGSSDKGDGNASIQGYLTVSEDDGSAIVEVLDGSISTVRHGSFDYVSNDSFYFDGTLYKQ